MTHTHECVGQDADRLQQQLDLRIPIEPRLEGCTVPLTADQRYLLKTVICSNPEQRPISVRLCISAKRIMGPLSLALLEGSIAGLLQRHEALRTTFKEFEGVTTQHIDPPDQYRLTCVDLSTLSKSEAESEAKRLTREFQDQRIDLSIGPVFEARLFKLATQEHVLIVLADHMISDGVSNELLEKEMWQAYDDALDDEPASPPTPHIQFADYAVWLERTKDARRVEYEDYWKQRRADGAPTIIPVSLDVNECPERGPLAHISFGSALTVQLRQFAERQQVSLSNVMLMIYATAMSLWCGKEDLIIRCPVHGRHGKPELKNVVGFFSSFVCLSIRVSRRLTLQGLLAQVQDEMCNVLAHRDLDSMLDLAPECLKTELEFHWRSARRSAQAVKKLLLNQPIKRHPFLIRSPGLPRWHLKFWCIFNETPSDICVTVRYQVHLLRPAAVEKFGNDMRSIAKSLIDRPLDPIHQVAFSCGRDIHDATQ
jgi:hypothetical protein